MNEDKTPADEHARGPQLPPDPEEIREEELPTAVAREQLARHEAAPPPDADPKPQAPQDVSKRGWMASFKRGFSEFLGDGCMDLAAALTYHSVMSLFPMLLAVVSLLGIFGQGRKTTDAVLDMLRDLRMQQGTLDNVGEIINGLQSSSGAGFALVIGILGALWSASNYVNGFSRAMNVIYGVKEGRKIIALRAWMLGITAIILLAVVVVGLSLVLTGPVAHAVGGRLGIGDTAVTVWNIAKWPFIAVVVVLIITLLYWATPNVRQPKFRWFTPGAGVAFLVWAVASAGFGFYVANFGSYNKTYGTLAGVIVFLLWLWITNSVLLLGAEFDAELERSRQLEAGLGAEKDIQLPLRGTATLRKQAEKQEEVLEDSRELRLANAEQLAKESGPSGGATAK